MNDTRNVSETGEKDIDQKGAIAESDGQTNTKWRKEDGEKSFNQAAKRKLLARAYIQHETTCRSGGEVVQEWRK